MKYIDLHTHSTASDGSFSPSKVAMLAKSADMKAIALTDHDTMAGVEECFKTGLQLDLPVIAGVEMSCVYNSKEIHILGYLLTIFQQKIFILRMKYWPTWSFLQEKGLTEMLK